MGIIERANTLAIYSNILRKIEEQYSYIRTQFEDLYMIYDEVKSDFAKGKIYDKEHIELENSFFTKFDETKSELRKFVEKQPGFKDFYKQNWREYNLDFLIGTTPIPTAKFGESYSETSNENISGEVQDEGKSESEQENNALHPLAYIYRIVSQDEIEEKFKKNFKLKDNDGNINDLGKYDLLEVIDDSYRIENNKDIITGVKEENSLQITHPKGADIEQSSVMWGLDAMVLYMKESGQSPFELDLDVKTDEFASGLVVTIMNKYAKNGKIDETILKGIIVNGKKIDISNVEKEEDLAVKFTEVMYPFPKVSNDYDVDFNSNAQPNPQGATANNQGVAAPQGATAVVPQDESENKQGVTAPQSANQDAAAKGQGETAKGQGKEENFEQGISNLNENIGKVFEALNALEGNSI